MSTGATGWCVFMLSSICVYVYKSKITELISLDITKNLPQSDLEWKVIYVGSAEDASADQILEEVMVGPVPVGINKFVLQAAAPNHLEISNQDIIGVTVVLVTCSFMEQEFIRIGYYVNNEYLDYDPENPPNPIDISKLYRSIRHDEPRVTRFAIDWTGGGGANMVPPLIPGISQEGEEQFLEGEADDLMAEVEEDGEDMGEDDEEEEGDDDDDEAEIDLDDDEEADESDDNMTVELNEDSMDVLQMQNQGMERNNGAQNFY